MIARLLLRVVVLGGDALESLALAIVRWSHRGTIAQIERGEQPAQ